MKIEVQIYINDESWGRKIYKSFKEARAGFEEFLTIIEEDFEQELREQKRQKEKWG